MFTKQNLVLAAAALAVSILLWAAHSGGQYPADRPHFPHSNLLITNQDKKTFAFDAEIASTAEEQAYGLMFIHNLPEGRAMIFPSSPPREVAFWMKNTLIPLDMLFIKPDGAIGRIVAEAQPEDVTPIPSQMPVIAVIEIAGGLAGKDGLAVGDKVESPALPPLKP